MSTYSKGIPNQPGQRPPLAPQQPPRKELWRKYAPKATSSFRSHFHSCHRCHAREINGYGLPYIAFIMIECMGGYTYCGDWDYRDIRFKNKPTLHWRKIDIPR
jgi:hypothetical protein